MRLSSYKLPVKSSWESSFPVFLIAKLSLYGDPDSYVDLHRAWKKFGGKKVLWAIESWHDWVGYGVFPHSKKAKDNYALNQLLKALPVLKVLDPPQRHRKPKLVYRGLKNLKERPTPGQPVTYSTKSPFTSWTEHYHTAQLYCSGGLVLTSKFRDLWNSGALFVWPVEKNSDLELASFSLGHRWVDQAEWSWILNKPVPIETWDACSGLWGGEEEAL